jgi:hypothetical protein
MVLTGQDFSMFAGDDGNLEIHVQRKNVSGALVDEDLTDADITWVLKEAADSTTALVTKTNAVITEIEIKDQQTDTGWFVVYLDPADTAALAAERYFHGVVIVDAALEVHTVETGYLTLSPKVI